MLYLLAVGGLFDFQTGQRVLTRYPSDTMLRQQSGTHLGYRHSTPNRQTRPEAICTVTFGHMAKSLHTPIAWCFLSWI
jgi:hypothetical protein